MPVVGVGVRGYVAIAYGIVVIFFEAAFSRLEALVTHMT